MQFSFLHRTKRLRIRLCFTFCGGEWQQSFQWDFHWANETTGNAILSMHPNNLICESWTKDLIKYLLPIRWFIPEWTGTLNIDQKLNSVTPTFPAFTHAHTHTPSRLPMGPQRLPLPFTCGMQGGRMAVPLRDWFLSVLCWDLYDWMNCLSHSHTNLPQHTLALSRTTSPKPHKGDGGSHGQRICTAIDTHTHTHILCVKLG